MIQLQRKQIKLHERPPITSWLPIRILELTNLSQFTIVASDSLFLKLGISTSVHNPTSQRVNIPSCELPYHFGNAHSKFRANRIPHDSQRQAQIHKSKHHESPQQHAIPLQKKKIKLQVSSLFTLKLPKSNSKTNLL